MILFCQVRWPRDAGEGEAGAEAGVRTGDPDDRSAWSAGAHNQPLLFL